MRPAHIAAILTWLYAAGFGIPAVPVAVFLLQRGYLPWFKGLFPMYGGPWSSQLPHEAFVGRLVAFLLVTLAASYAAWLLWKGSRIGVILGLLLLPVEAVFWIGFALPIPWLFGIARAALMVAAWISLVPTRSGQAGG